MAFGKKKQAKTKAVTFATRGKQQDCPALCPECDRGSCKLGKGHAMLLDHVCDQNPRHTWE
jgi:hypothetical protein